jgi:cytidylate kinase
VKSILCLSGAMASGKTTISRALAEHWTYAEVRSFGDVVRARARTDGRPVSRESLQQIGLQLVAEGWDAFVHALVHDVSPETDLLIVDGIRHVGAVEAIRGTFTGASVSTVHLRITGQVAVSRMRERGESPAVRAHEVEGELAEVERRAEVVVSGSLPPATIVRIIDGLMGDPRRIRTAP